jgi:hypothetical protein
MARAYVRRESALDAVVNEGKRSTEKPECRKCFPF